MPDTLPEGYTMSRFLPPDIKLLRQVNVDYLSETYTAEYYLHYLVKYPTLCHVVHYDDHRQGDKKAPDSAGIMSSLLGPFRASLDANERLAAYILGRCDYAPAPPNADRSIRVLYGHVSAVSVGPQHRRRHLATLLMDVFERECERLGCLYIDLFVRPSNATAVRMYQRRGYVIYRRIREYYGGDTAEDAFGIHPACSYP
jgi:N-terminal acetyltransferase B complex catalytic subunit